MFIGEKKWQKKSVFVYLWTISEQQISKMILERLLFIFIFEHSVSKLVEELASEISNP